MTQAKTTKQPKEGLPEKLKVETFGQDSVCIFDNDIGGSNRSLIKQRHFDEEDRKINEAICFELVHRYNERQSLLDSNKELLGIVKRLDTWHHLEDGIFTYTDPNNDGDQLTIDLQTAINNAKNI